MGIGKEWESIRNGEVVRGKDHFSGLCSVTSLVENDRVKVNFEASNPTDIYGYYSARRFRNDILYFISFCLVDVMAVAGVVLYWVHLLDH